MRKCEREKKEKGCNVLESMVNCLCNKDANSLQMRKEDAV